MVHFFIFDRDPRASHGQIFCMWCKHLDLAWTRYGHHIWCLFLFLQTIFADSGHTFPFLAEILGHTRLPMAKYSVCGRYHLTWPGCKGLSIPANFLRFNLGKLAGFNQSGSTRLIRSTCCKGLSSFLLFRPTDMDQYSSYPSRVICSHIWCCTQDGHFSLGS